ncbi:hypothetical protein [Pseudogulbenkiania ferrooxidans]|uniref:hypothetical protein n=1 Tax=Pseudogulbenkiania ferrooxidans TaxID=549169 RepID=UPI001237949D|nr:hypothetical protein [Pseudogulbenkiania ferrooxidans]
MKAMFAKALEKLQQSTPEEIYEFVARHAETMDQRALHARYFDLEISLIESISIGSGVFVAAGERHSNCAARSDDYKLAA